MPQQSIGSHIHGLQEIPFFGGEAAEKEAAGERIPWKCGDACEEGVGLAPRGGQRIFCTVETDVGEGECWHQIRSASFCQPFFQADNHLLGNLLSNPDVTPSLGEQLVDVSDERGPPALYNFLRLLLKQCRDMFLPILIDPVQFRFKQKFGGVGHPPHVVRELETKLFQ